MIERFIEISQNQKVFTICFTIMIILGGLWAWKALKKEAYPDIGDTQVTVIVRYPGRAALEVEQLITLPLERALGSVPQVISRRSKTIFGLCVYQLVFDDGTDDYFARQRILEKLSLIDLPEGADFDLAPLTSPVGEILRYVIESEDYHSQTDLRTFQEWIVIPRLLQVKGVADVINFGGLSKQYHAVVFPERLYGLNLSLDDVVHSIQKNNYNTGGNYIHSGEQSLAIRSMGAIRSKDDLESIVVKNSGGVPVFLSQLGRVEEGYKPPSGILGYYYLKDGIQVQNPSGVQGMVVMRRGSNPTEVIQSLKKKIKDINENILPKGAKLTLVYDRSNLVDHTIRTVGRTVLEGILFVLIILIFFMGSWSTALIVATTIPISLLFAFGMMYITGIPVNLLSLGAIDFGIIVDGSVVMVEALLRSIRKPEDRNQAHFIAVSKDTGKEIFFSILIIILSYFPIFSLQRVEGKLFSPMAYTLSFAIGGSLLLTLSIVPILLYYTIRKSKSSRMEWENPIYLRMEKYYSLLLDKLFLHFKKYAILGFSIAFFIFSITFYRIGVEYLPELDEGSLNIRAFLPAGISLQTARTISDESRSLISSKKEVNLVVSQLGRNDDGTDPYGSNRIEILVGLYPYEEWESGKSKAELADEIKSELIRTFPGVKFLLSQPIMDNVAESATGSVADLAIHVAGTDLVRLRELGNEILSVISSIPGSVDGAIEQEASQAQVVIEIKRREAARYGINISEIQDMIEASIGGKEISTLYEDAWRFGIVVRYPSSYKNSIKALEGLLIKSENGAFVPLKDLAYIDEKDGPTIIQRNDNRRVISVRTNIRGRDQAGFVKEAQEQVSKKVTLDKRYELQWGGQYENLIRAGDRLMIIIPITFFLVFILLYFHFKDFRYSLTAMICVPFSLTGGVVFLALRGYHFNVSAGIGFISLFGICTMTGVLFLSRMKKHSITGSLEERIAAVKEAAVLQYKPRIMTILLALCGLIPAMLGHGVGSDIQRYMATVIVGGLFCELFLTLTLLPCFYLWICSEEGQGA
ncbi:efflux RND transporter permease subunit [Leptospira idonii]|uniref:Efflux RND transporter permease subunit n=1 Tax=Leptospira idonii TaxID=1193500 RepID=A0A4V3JYC7_9LEPT|nr:CusA/CzcA family heavy metal efflux RND transporter [Leptospira idonii]TGN20746.1 efflux RND transporter permease subunit [Leptospira idonii]